jgi:hypothetical protein
VFSELLDKALACDQRFGKLAVPLEAAQSYLKNGRSIAAVTAICDSHSEKIQLHQHRITMCSHLDGNASCRVTVVSILRQRLQLCRFTAER